MDFNTWLEELPAGTVGKLYSSHWACQAVLRGLPPLAKQYVLRLLFLDLPVPAGGARHPAACLHAGPLWNHCGAVLVHVQLSWSPGRWPMLRQSIEPH